MSISATVTLPGLEAIWLKISAKFDSLEAAQTAIDTLLVGGLAAHAVRVVLQGKSVAVFTAAGVCAFGVTLGDDVKAPVWVVESAASNPVEHLKALFIGGALEAIVAVSDSDSAK
jgi:hypothetical protein